LNNHFSLSDAFLAAFSEDIDKMNGKHPRERLLYHSSQLLKLEEKIKLPFKVLNFIVASSSLRKAASSLQYFSLF
jgi:hypothetical protein